MVHSMIEEFKDDRVSVSLPSLRIDSFCVAIAKEIQAVRKSGLTFAPEAGSQKMRDVINKGVTEEDLMNAVGAAFESGWNSVKLYFMIGLPFENDDDVLAIADLARKVQYKYYQVTGKRGCKVTCSASFFVPKPYTAFQWFAQDDLETIRRKQFLLKDEIKTIKNVTLNYHDSKTGIIEAVFARGDRKVGKALLAAWRRGARFDGWSDLIMSVGWRPSLRLVLTRTFTLRVNAVKMRFSPGSIFLRAYLANSCGTNGKKPTRSSLLTTVVAPLAQAAAFAHRFARPRTRLSL